MRVVNEMIKLLAIIIAVICFSFTGGVLVERSIWENYDMAGLCLKGHSWACHLHPKCTMYSMMCFSKLTENDIRTIQMKLDRFAP